jgi:SAM-dependent methyltransferase
VIREFPCPVCSRTSWVEHEKFVYARADHQNAGYSPFKAAWRIARNFVELLVFGRRRRRSFRNTNLTRYQRERRSVLFERWFPGADEVSLTAIFCADCGFMSFAPRPERRDLDSKYEFLKELSGSASYPQFSSSAATALDRSRAEWLFHAVHSCIDGQGKMRVLDYGGGDGRLMLPFVKLGHECFVLDYSDDQVAGVTRLGADLNELGADDRFDVIVASHVLEHLAQPRETLCELRHHLAPGGIMYCEVPSEILGGLWIDNDPVTHVNFFTLGSFKRLLQEADLAIRAGGRRIGNYGRNFRDTLWAVASCRVDPAAAIHEAPDIESYLYPRRRDTLLLLIELLWKRLRVRVTS